MQQPGMLGIEVGEDLACLSNKPTNEKIKEVVQGMVVVSVHY
jgi:hypothetical protein